MRTRTYIAAGLLAACFACNQVTINTPIRSFDRPSDVALSCIRFNSAPENRVIDADDLDNCRPEIARTKVSAADENGQTFQPSLFGLVVQSARGELSVVNIASAILVDINPRVPGYGFLPVGRLPEHVRASSDGCRAVTANVDSCDLAFVDLPTLYNLPRLNNRVAGTVTDGGLPILTKPPGFGENVVRRLSPAVNGRPLGARPQWIEMAPESQKGLRGWEPGGMPGQCLGGAYYAWVALPGCELVVEVDLNGTDVVNGITPAEVRQAIRVTQAGTQVLSAAEIATLSCPAECSGTGAAPDGGATTDAGAADGGPSDAGPSDGGTPDLAPPPRMATTQAMPTTIAIDVENQAGRMFIGDQLGERVSVLPIDVVTGALGTPRTITLEAGAIGVQVVRVSPRSEAGKYLYAVARDASVRVVDLDREVECETNPDPRAFRDIAPEDPQLGARALGCFPLGAPGTPVRSPLATSPGITLQLGALPRDVAFVHLDVPPPPANPQVSPPGAGPSLLVGDFAWVLGSNGRANLINIYDACPAPNVPQGVAGSYTPACDLGNAAASRVNLPLLPGQPQPLTLDRLGHRVRASQNRFVNPPSCGDNAGAPRLRDEANPYTLSVSGEARKEDAAGGRQFPKLVTKPLPAVSGAACPSLTRHVEFFEPDRLQNETWTLAWEGIIPGTQRGLGRPLPGGKLLDAGGAYCQRGVLAGDKLQLTGCTKNEECDFAQECVRDLAAPASVLNGLCLDREPTRKAAQTKACGLLMRSARRYRILKVRQGLRVGTEETTDQLDLAEIYQPEFASETKVCDEMKPDDCAGITIATKNAAGLDIKLPTTCLTDSDGVTKRCLRACASAATDDSLRCGGDFICAKAVQGGERCMRAPLDAAYFTPVEAGGFGCLRELQPYQISAGDAFTVTGSTTGFLTDLQPNPVTRECEVPPISSQQVRLRQSRIPLGAPMCPATLTDILEPLLPGSPNVCTFLDDATSRQIHFENLFFAFGLDLPAAKLQPPENFTLQFVVVGGGVPFSLALGADAVAQHPRSAVVAPDRATVYVIDEGKQTVATGLRGQLIRLISSVQTSDRFFLVR